MSQHIDHPRRRFMTQSAGILGATGLGMLPTVAQSKEKDKYGIKGGLAPEIKLDYWIDKDGKETEFSVLKNRGKWVFLKFFQSWCPGCHASGFPALKAFSDEFWDHPDVAIAGVQTVFEGYGANTQADVRKLQKRYELPVTMGHDQGDPKASGRERFPKVMVDYFTGGTPWLVLIEPGGMVVFNNFHVDSTKLIEFMKGRLEA